MVVHVLGNSPKIDLISKLCKEKIYLIEDTCSH